MKVLGLFSGIGGMELGLERAGMTIAAMCETDPFCRGVLARRWPGVPLYDDVRSLGHVGDFDVIAGGFPCQDTSVAGAIHGDRAGLGGNRSGLWFDMLRLVGVHRPLWVIVENTPGVLAWANTIKVGLEGHGYAVSRHDLSACDVGAWHRRKRCFFIAHRDRSRLEIAGAVLASAHHCDTWPAPAGDLWPAHHSGTSGSDDGLSPRMDRIRALGNAIIPEKAGLIGHAIQAA